MTWQLHWQQVVLSQVSHARTAADGTTEEAAWSSMAVHSSDVPECARPLLKCHCRYDPIAHLKTLSMQRCFRSKYIRPKGDLKPADACPWL